MDELFCAGCGRDLDEDTAIKVRETDTGLEMTLGRDCCLGQEDGYVVL